MKRQVVLTVSESKRLIAKAVAGMEVVQKAKKDGILVISGGTTNSDLAEEILGHPIDKRAFRHGITVPAVNPERGGGGDPQGTPDLVLRKGQVDSTVNRITVVPEMGRGDVFIKGTNALDYKNKVAGILIANPSGGSVGGAWGHIYGTHLHLIIPVGLEKLVYEDIYALARRTMDPDYVGPTLYPVTGTIVTEIEALRLLTGVEASLLAAGGVAGAEGAVRLLLEGTAQQVEQALTLVGQIQGEPRWVL